MRIGTDDNKLSGDVTHLEIAAGGSTQEEVAGKVVVTLPGGGSQTVLKASVTLSSAEILALASTAIQIAPAAGAGLMLVPLQATVTLDFGSIAYADGGDLVLIYHGDEAENLNVYLLAASGSLVREGADSIVPTAVTPNDSANAYTPASQANVGLDVFNDSSAFTAGDGTVTVTLLYYTIAVP